MIFERKKPRRIMSFMDIEPGNNFTDDDGSLFLKVTNQLDSCNAVNLTDNRLMWIGPFVRVNPIEVKIVEVTE